MILEARQAEMLYGGHAMQKDRCGETWSEHVQARGVDVVSLYVGSGLLALEQRLL